MSAHSAHLLGSCGQSEVPRSWALSSYWNKSLRLICRNTTISWIWLIPFLMVTQLPMWCYSWQWDCFSCTEHSAQPANWAWLLWGSVCVCVCVSVTPRLVYILCTLRGEHNIEKCNTECRLVSLGVACLSLPNVPWVLKPENYPHTHLKRENCQQTFCPACGCSWRKKGGKKQPRKTQCFRSFQALSGQLWSNMFSLCLLALMLKLSLGKLWDGYSVTSATCIMLHTGLEGFSGILKDSGPAALLNVKPVSLGVIVLCFLYCHLPSGFYLQPSVCSNICSLATSLGTRCQPLTNAISQSHGGNCMHLGI